MVAIFGFGFGTFKWASVLVMLAWFGWGFLAGACGETSYIFGLWSHMVWLFPLVSIDEKIFWNGM